MTHEQERARFVNLSWDLIGYKFYYYYPEKVHPSWRNKLDIPDGDYDELENEYLRLCLSLGEKNTVCGKTFVDGVAVDGKGMTELDFSRPSIKLAEKKYTQRRRN